MRILYFSSRECWPPNTGARLRDYHLAHQLAFHADLTYVALAAPGASPPEPLPAEAGFQQVIMTRGRSYTPAKLLAGLLGSVPVTIRNYTSATAAASLEALLGREAFDVVQIEGVHLAQYIPAIRRAAPKAALIADWHNIESELMYRYSESSGSLPRRLFARRTATLIAQAEDRLLTTCDAHAVVSERERDQLLMRAPEAKIDFVPNGVDIDSYRGLAPCPTQGHHLIFVGSMDYHANIDAVRWFGSEVWPALARQVPETVFSVVGRNPAPELLALASKRLKLTGTVDDVRPYYRDALAMLVPLRVGGGTRLKILEAMAAGVPIISSRLGAEGIPVAHERHILFAETVEEWIAAVQRLKQDPALRARLAAEAFELASNHFGWPAAAGKLIELHRSVQR